VSVKRTLNYKKNTSSKNTKQYSNTIKVPSLQAADNNGYYTWTAGYEVISYRLWRSSVRPSQMYLQVQPTRCHVTQFIYFCEMLYMFQAVPPHIIRSSKLYIQHRVLVKPLLLRAAANSSTIVAGSSKDLKSTGCCIYSFELLMIRGGTAWNM
jgi:hypothetical protein